MARSASDASVIGSGTRVAGRVSGRGDLQIEGTVRGDVSVGGATEIAEGASVEGDVETASLSIAGTLIGDVKSRGPVAVQRSANVRGGIEGERVSVEPGARLSGRIDANFEIEAGGAPRGRSRR
jgi:cytoskeletal protein CcmA (bactofilin family)